MLDLNDVRKEFSDFLAADPAARWRMDAALAHIATMCYRRGIEDAAKQQQGENECLTKPTNPTSESN